MTYDHGMPGLVTPVTDGPLALLLLGVTSRKWSRNADASTAAVWTTGKGAEGFVALSNEEPNLELLSDPETFSAEFVNLFEAPVSGIY